MNEPEKKSTIQKNVLEAIRSGRAAMRPRWHFVLGAVALAVGVVILLLALLSLSSFIVFFLNRSGAIVGPQFGPSGLLALLRALPWLLVALCVLFAVLLELLIRHYALAYRRPLVYSMLAVVILTAVGAALIAHAHLHDRLYHRARANRLGFASGFYRRFGASRAPSIQSGRIRQLTAQGFLLDTAQGTTIAVMVTPRTRRRSNLQLAPAEQVFVFGRLMGNSMLAFAVRLADSDDESK